MRPFSIKKLAEDHKTITLLIYLDAGRGGWKQVKIVIAKSSIIKVK